MSGEMILKNSGRWKQILPAVLLTAVATFACVWPLVHHVKASGMMQGIMAAVVTYILFRTLYPALAKMMHADGQALTLHWEVTGDELKLGEDTISLDTIKRVHCWPNRDALGNRLTGWTVNIETTGKNRVLCSLEEGGEAEKSAEQLYDLVAALGYKDAWVEE